ncbi:MAG: V-type ATP synthase subunit E family protein [Candidatus Omnitrophota bacterium]
MAVEDIIKKILVEAEEKAGGILTQGREVAQRIKKEAEVRAQEMAGQIVRTRRDLSNQEARRIISLARLESKKAILVVRQKMLNQVFSDRKVKVKDVINKIVISFEGEKKEALEPEIYLKLRRPEYEAAVAGILFEGIASGTDEK